MLASKKAQTEKIRIGSAAFGPDQFRHSQPILSLHFLHHMVLL
jgi:hypothetical protein